MADIKNLKVASQMDAFKKDLIDYQGLMNKLAQPGERAHPDSRGLEDSCGPGERPG